MRPVAKGESPRKFKNYSQALPFLEEQLGSYCSYCEQHINNQLAIEHIQPKSRQPELTNDWDNFLLSCAVCNSIKRMQEIVLEDYFWPHLDNTLRAFNYSEEGRMETNPLLSPERQEIALRTLELTGLNRDPGHPRQSRRDMRWKKRREVWGEANLLKRDLLKNDSVEQRERIVICAKWSGFWSVWMSVFSEDTDMRQRLIAAFLGTCLACFDEETQPLLRPGGAL